MVTVWAPDDSAAQIARGVREYDVPVLVAVQKKLTPEAGDGSTEAANPELDALRELAERVADFFGTEHVDVGGACWASTDLNLGNPDAMRQNRQFFAVATFRFQLRRKR